MFLIEPLPGNCTKALLGNLLYGPELELQPDLTWELFDWIPKLDKSNPTFNKVLFWKWSSSKHSVRFHFGRFCSSPELELQAKPGMGSKKSNLELELSIKFHLGSLFSSPELELLLKCRLGGIWLSFELKLSPKSHLGSPCLSPELGFSLTSNLGESLIKSWAGTFPNASLGKPLFEFQVGTVVKFCCRVFDRDSNCNSQ